MHVSSELKPANMATSPLMSRENRIARHKFYIPGLIFIVIVNKALSAESNGVALNSSDMVYLCSLGNDGLSQNVAESIQYANGFGKFG